MLLLAILLLPYCYGDASRHHYDADQWDVISPEHNPCATSRGFFGRLAKYESKVNYQYEVTFVAGNYLNEALVARSAGGPALRGEGLENVLSAIETGIADSILESRVFQSACSGGEARGPFRRGDGRGLLRKNERTLRAVGISSNPEDEILEGRESDCLINFNSFQ